MYRAFYNLRDYPFNINPDPRFLHFTRGAYDALACLFYSLSRRRGLVLMTGEVGTGKTTLLNYLLQELCKRRIPRALLVNPRLTPTEFLELVLSEFEIHCPSQRKGQMLRELHRWLRERQGAGQMAVLIVDEAHTLSFEMLEEIRLLTNFETSTQKFLQIVLSGQPELERKLNLPQMRQVKQRIALHVRLTPLSLKETEGYIRTRLQRAGTDGKTLFLPEAVSAIHAYSAGIPRLINLICENALISGYAAQVRPVTVELVDEAAKGLQLEATAPSPGIPPEPFAELPPSLEEMLSDPQMSVTFREFLQLMQHLRKAGLLSDR